MSKKQHIRWTEEMYACLAWRLFEDLYGATEWYEEEDQRIHSYAKAAREKLDVFSRKVVDNRARRLSNEYHEHILYSLEKMYWHEIHDRDDGYLQPPIEYDTHHYETWSEGVNKRRTVRMVYDSTTSGTSERLVDPYQTRTPYADGN